MNDNKTAGVGGSFSSHVFWWESWNQPKVTWLEVATGQNTVPCPWLVLSPGPPDFQERMALSKELYTCSYGRCL